MALSDGLRDILMDPRQAEILRSRADRVLSRGISLFSKGDVIAAWAPLIGRERARELLDALAFAERLDPEEFALVGELTLIAEDCYRALSTEIDGDGREWRQIQWSYTERLAHRSMLIHFDHWDGEVSTVRTSADGLSRLIRRLCEAQREFAARGGAVDADELQQAHDLIDESIEASADTASGEDEPDPEP